jgi:hypothetical protein
LITLWPLAGLLLLAAPALDAQTISVDQQSLTFTSAVNGPPTSLTVNVSTSPTAAVTLATAVEQTDLGVVTWLSVSPTGGETAPIVYALSTQTSAMAPYEMAGQSTESMVVEYQGVQSLP